MSKNKILHLSLITFFSLALLNGCGQKFVTSDYLSQLDNSSESNGSLDSGNSGTSPTTPNNAYQKLDMKGAVQDSGEFNNKRVIDFDKGSGNFLLKLPLPTSLFIGALEMNLPSLPGSTITAISDDSGNYLQVSIPARYILKGVNFIPSERLPNGEALPSIPSGELPSLAISLPNQTDVNVHLYLGVNVLAAYLEIPQFNNPRLGIIKRITLPVKNANKTKIMGYFTLLGPSQLYPGGIFVSSQIPASIAKIIDDNLPIN